MNLVQGQGRDPRSPSPIALRPGLGHGHDAGGGAAGRDQSRGEGDLYQKRSAKGLQSTGPSPGKENEKGQAPGIIENQFEHEVAPQAVGVGVTLRVGGEGLDLQGEGGALVFPPAAGAAPPAAGAAPPAAGAALPADGAVPPAVGAVPLVAGVAPPAGGGDQDLS